MKLYIVELEDKNYLMVNITAETEEEAFGSTKKLSEATFFSKDSLKMMREAFESYNYYLFMSNLRQFLKVKKILSYEMNLLGEEEVTN